MINISPVLEDRPMVSWLGDGRNEAVQPGGRTGALDTDSAASLQREVDKLVQAGFGCVAFALPTIISELTPAHPVLTAIACCRQTGLPVWLRVPAPSIGSGPGLYYQVQDIGAAMAPGWEMPADANELVAAIAAPLGGPRLLPQWEKAVSLHGLGEAEQRAQVEILAHEAGARIWVWSQRNGEAGQSSPAYAETWLKALSPFLQLCQGLGLRDSIAGVYLDGTHHEAAGEPNRFPWLVGLPEKFEALYNYDLRTHLPSLVADTGALGVQIRQHYWLALQELYQETCWQPIKDQVEALGLKLNGGALLPGSVAESVSAVVSAPGLANYLSTPGLIAPIQHGKGAGSSYLQARLAASAAALSGGKQASAQTVNGGGWDDTPQSGLMHLRHLLHAGITRFQTQGVLDPAAATSPALPSIVRQPFVRHFAQLNTYLAHSSALLAGGQPGARTALLWPERSLRAHYNPHGHRITRWIEEDLVSTVNLLQDLHFDFLFLEEGQIDEGEIESLPGAGCALRCGQAGLRFEMVVLPSVSALSRQVWRKLEKFVQAGGRVVCLGLLPRWSENGRDPEMEAYIGKATMIVVADLYDAYAQAEGAPGEGDEPSVIGYPVVRSWASGGRLGCYQPRLNTDAGDARLRVRQMLSESLIPEMETQATEVLLTRRLRPEGELVHVFNTADRTQRVNLRVRPLQPGSPYLCDAWSGAAVPIREWMPLTELDGGGLALPLELAAGTSQFVWIEYGAPVPHVLRANFTVTDFDGQSIKGYAIENGIAFASVRRALDDKFERWHSNPATLPAPLPLFEGWLARRLGPNLLKLQDCQCRPGRSDALDASGANWHSLDAPLPLNFDKRIMDEGRGALAYRGSFTVSEKVSPLWLRIEGETASLDWPGNSVVPQKSPFPADPLWADRALWFDLSAAGPGTYTLHLTVALGGASGHTLPYPLLVGDFEVGEDYAIIGPQEIEIETGPWQAQGLPYYAGALELRRTEAVPDSWAGCRLFLELAQIRDSVEAIVNGQTLGVRVAAPFRFDISNAIRPGAENEIVLRFWSTAATVMGNAWDETVPAGLLGPARLVAYPQVEIERPL